MASNRFLSRAAFTINTKPWTNIYNDSRLTTQLLLVSKATTNAPNALLSRVAFHVTNTHTAKTCKLPKSFYSTHSSQEVGKSVNCWKCGNLLNVPPNDDYIEHPADQFYCLHKACGVLQPAQDINHFEQFQLPVNYELDTQNLTKLYRRIQHRLHPDKAVQLSQEEKEFADKHSTAVNHAYEVLLKPVSRALYMLSLNGLSIEEGDLEMDPEFLMDIMERNELVSDNDDEEHLRALFDDNRCNINSLIKKISQAFNEQDFESAKVLIGMIKYFVNIEDKIKEKTYFH
ncbi:iron-sulfur cluster co-chaperone protein HscB-like [Watersipora subatra]|uniref:iron-sulfur cluster co-chaperone protein HscB-like n=1 Tax=Watersipora subatra TaxID=2589382 RepID=UPI00355BFA01